MNTCGKCKFGKPIPGDLTKRVCMFGPPQIASVPVQTPKGIAFQTGVYRPNVNSSDEAPSCFQAGIYGLDDMMLATQVIAEQAAS